MNKELQLFEEALKIAKEHLDPAHPIRLNVAVNYSRFCYYSLDSVNKALSFAEEGHGKGLWYLSELPDELKNRLESLKVKIDK